MFRDRMNDLLNWRDAPNRKPLIIRGCRQVGKSWLVDEFAKNFSSYVKINFEKQMSVHQYFKGDLDVKTIIEKLSLVSHSKIKIGETLLFLDEIQECEQAIQILRYFKEELPKLHVIAAGSLLDFALNRLGIPVGRVQFMWLYPLSFGEFLSVMNRDDYRQYIFKQEHDAHLHHELLDLVATYMWLGGMPAVVNAWRLEKDVTACQYLQDEIIESYQIDFHKYAKEKDIPHVSQTFAAIPAFLGRKFIYSKVNQDSRNEVIKNALLLLETAGIAHRCCHTSAQALPLAAEKNDKRFKVYYFDIGIAQRLLGLDVVQWQTKYHQQANQGAIAEQFVAQEMMAYSNFRKRMELYYWHREAKSSNAEVDFVVVKNGVIVPVEVKSSHKGQMKSLSIFLASHNHSDYGLKISKATFAQHQDLHEIPFYALESWFLDPN